MNKDIIKAAGRIPREILLKLDEIDWPRVNHLTRLTLITWFDIYKTKIPLRKETEHESETQNSKEAHG